MLDPNGHPVVASLLDLMMAPLHPVRRRVIRHARGRVLEIGIGTAANLRLLPEDAPISELVGIEPDPHMRRRAQNRIDRLRPPFPVTLLDADAAALPFEDGSFDTILATFVLCTIPDPAAAAHEMHRALAHDGQLLWAEHTAAAGTTMRGLQKRLTPCWRQMAGGCHLDRDSVSLLQEAGFALSVHSRPRHPHHPLPVHYGTGSPAKTPTGQDTPVPPSPQ
ncbi:MAG: class I SAM-dependent methyltransferase [Deltaproteobacteria bacterium]|nr:MAG: class I SAM-dependent methyltransferase [Deltaproteobacteria bacterium]